jgi:hypothetical protein
MSAGQKITRVGLVTVEGRERMAFIREGRVFYFPSISSRKALPATEEAAATWEYVKP